MSFEDIRTTWRWARVFMCACAAVCAYFTSGYFITHDAGFGATLVTLGEVWLFWKWNKNIDEREAWELHIEAVRRDCGLGRW